MAQAQDKHGDEHHEERAALQRNAASLDSSDNRYRNGSDQAPADQASLFEHAVGAVQRNPVLAVATVAVASAIVVMALKPSRTPQSKIRALERRAARQLEAAEQQLRNVYARSGVGSTLEGVAASLASRLATLDASQLDPLRERATAAFNRAVDRIGSVVK